MTNDELLAALDAQRSLMAAVATGGPRIDDKNDEYQRSYRQIAKALASRGVDNPNPYRDLWQWYGKWSSDLGGYKDRRKYLADLFAPTIELLTSRQSERRSALDDEPTGWERVDRTVDKVKAQLDGASEEEDFQRVGLLCRELLISLAQAVYDPDLHPSVDGTKPSKTDAKRMLEAYVAVELAGKSNAAARKHARASLDLANDLQHRRTAGFRDAALCAEASTSVVNIVSIVSGKRDPEPELPF